MKRWFVGALVVAVVTTTATERASADKEAASKLLAEGNSLLEAGESQKALEKFEAAYLEFPASLLLNIGTTLRELGRNADAANKYAEWESQSKDSPRLAEVQLVLKELDARVGVISVKPNVPGVSITVGDVGDVSARSKLRVEPGAYEVHAKKEGYENAKAVVSLRQGEDKEVVLVLKPISRETQLAPPLANPQTEAAPAWHQDPLGWALVGGGVVATGIGIALLSSAASTQRSANEEPDQEAAQALEDKASTRRLGGAIAAGVGGALLVAGVIKLAMTPESKAPSGVVLLPTPTSMQVGYWGRF